MKSSRLLLSSCLIGVGAALGYSWVTRSEAPDPGASPRMQSVAAPTDSRPATSTSAPADAAPSSPQRAQVSIDELLADARSDDERKRSAAIIALANVPKAHALPALQRAADVSSSEGDRHLALRSLYTLAVEQGDEDLRIRDTFRSAIYHSGDEGVSQSAQAFLEDLDVVLAAPER